MKDKKISFEERKRLIQDTIDRILKYDLEYVRHLEEINKKFPN